MKYILNNDNLEVVGKQYLDGVGGYDGANLNKAEDLATVIKDLQTYCGHDTFKDNLAGLKEEPVDPWDDEWCGKYTITDCVEGCVFKIIEEYNNSTTGVIFITNKDISLNNSFTIHHNYSEHGITLIITFPDTDTCVVEYHDYNGNFNPSLIYYAQGSDSYFKTFPYITYMPEAYIPNTIARKSDIPVVPNIDPVVWKYICTPYCIDITNVINHYTEKSDPIPSDLQNVLHNVNSLLIPKVIVLTNNDFNLQIINQRDNEIVVLDYNKNSLLFFTINDD